MKTYEKPRLMALSLSGNDRLCGDCGDKSMTLWNNPSIAAIILEIAEINPASNGIDGIDKGDFDQVFASSQDGCARPVSAYCKFASATTVAWS